MALKTARASRTPAPVLRTRTRAPLASYVVLVDASNGMKIAGKRRARGETFQADPRHMAFLMREGVVAPAPAAAPPAAPAPAA